MFENNQQQIKIINTRGLPSRIVPLVIIILAIIFGWFSIRWQLGNMFAEMTSPSEPNSDEISALSKSLAPSDPLASWLFANTQKSDSSEENEKNKLEGLKQSVALSPFDYRWWIELARGYEQNGNNEMAEQCYLKAIEYAPEYTYPHWQLGNFYMRQDRSDEAFKELKIAAQKDPDYRKQVFSIAWDYYGQDTARLEQIAGDLPDVKTGLVLFYGMRGRAEDSLRIWNTLSEEEKKENQQIARVVAQGLYERKFYHPAIGFVSSLGIEPNAKLETIQNGGFEDAINFTDYIYFAWKVSPLDKMDVRFDAAQKTEGTRSLRITFNRYNNAQLYNIYQTVAVKPGANYTLSFKVKTENLKSPGLPVIEVVNAIDGRLLSVSKPFASGTTDWNEMKIDFSVPADSEAIYFRTSREFCGEGCVLSGTFWYDDFKLIKR